MLADARPGLFEPLPRQRRGGVDGRAPRDVVRVQQLERRAKGLHGAQRSRLPLAVGFVDHHDVGELHDPALDTLELIAGSCEQKQDKDVGHLRDRPLALPHPDRLDDHHVKTSRFADQHRLAARCDAPEGRPRRRWPDEGGVVAAQALHARLVPMIEPPVRLDVGSTANTATR